MRNTILYGSINAVVVSISTAVVNQIRKGEPRLDHALLFGVSFGIALAAVHHWQKKKKTNAENRSR